MTKRCGMRTKDTFRLHGTVQFDGTLRAPKYTLFDIMAKKNPPKHQLQAGLIFWMHTSFNCSTIHRRILPELSEKPRLFRAGMDSSEGEAFLAFMFLGRLPHCTYCI